MILRRLTWFMGLTLTYGTGRQRENLGAEMSPPGTLLLT